MSLLEEGMCNFSSGPWALFPGPDLPVQRNIASEYLISIIAIKGIVPPSLIEQSSFPKKAKEELQKDYDKRVASQQFSSTVKGYRKGKAPKEIIEQMYGSQIKANVIFDAMTESFFKKISEDSIQVVGQPKFDPKSMVLD